jgi:hypothetical protein
MTQHRGDLSDIARGVQGVHCAGVPPECADKRAFSPCEGCFALGCSQVYRAEGAEAWSSGASGDSTLPM